MYRTLIKLISSAVALLAVGGASVALAASHHQRKPAPVHVTVLSPGAGDHSGQAGVGFIVDVALDATRRDANALLSSAAGYKPFFHDPTAADFHPGPDQGAPGLVVMLSSTPVMPGTPFMGPRTNLAGLFQINGVAQVKGLNETWNTWQPGKPLFGLNRHVRLTIYVVRGTAPALVPTHGEKIISNIVNVPFTINR